MICLLIFCFIFGAVSGSRRRLQIFLHSRPREQASTWLCCKENRFYTDEMACSQACLRHSWCTSSNFKESSGSCELNKHEFSITVDDDSKLTDNTGTTFSMFLKVSRREVCQQRTRCKNCVQIISTNTHLFCWKNCKFEFCQDAFIKNGIQSRDMFCIGALSHIHFLLLPVSICDNFLMLLTAMYSQLFLPSIGLLVLKLQLRKMCSAI